MMIKRKPVAVGEMLAEEFMKPLELTQTALAKTMVVERRLVNELCKGRRAVTVDTALMLPACLATRRNSGSTCSDAPNSGML